MIQYNQEKRLDSQRPYCGSLSEKISNGEFDSILQEELQNFLLPFESSEEQRDEIEAELRDEHSQDDDPIDWSVLEYQYMNEATSSSNQHSDKYILQANTEFIEEFGSLPFHTLPDEEINLPFALNTNDREEDQELRDDSVEEFSQFASSMSAQSNDYKPLIPRVDLLAMNEGQHGTMIINHPISPSGVRPSLFVGVVDQGGKQCYIPYGSIFGPTNVTPCLAHHQKEDASKKFQRWSEEEDDVLKYAIECEGGRPYNWKRIAKKHFNNSRTGLQCKSRWTKSLQPGIVRGEWLLNEDQKILQYKEDGFKWSEIAEFLPGRIAEHVRDRYTNFLDPALKKIPWTAAEDAILFEQQRRVGNKWTRIAAFIPGRSENSVKNRWHNLKMTERRRQRKEAAERKRLSRQNETSSRMESGNHFEGESASTNIHV